MTLITDKPEELKPENDLDGLVDDSINPWSHPGVISAMGRHLIEMETPPRRGQLIKVEVTLEGRDVLDKAIGEDDSKFVHIMRYVGAKLITGPYDPPPKAPADEPPPPPSPKKSEDPSLLDPDGQIPDDEGQGDGDGDAELADDAVDDIEPDTAAPDDLTAHDPEFSSGTPR